MDQKILLQQSRAACVLWGQKNELKVTKILGGSSKIEGRRGLGKGRTGLLYNVPLPGVSVSKISNSPEARNAP